MKGIPVFTFHHVAPDRQSPLTVLPRDFEGLLEWLGSSGTRTFSLDEFAEALGKQVKPRGVLLTFDDGYVDNWVYAYPLLRKYGQKAVLFLTTGSVVDSEEKRGVAGEGREVVEVPPHSEGARQLAGGSKAGERTALLNWAEVIEMEASGAFDVQSHGQTHIDFGRCGEAENKEEFFLKEMRAAKGEIERRLNKKCLGLAWPKGRYSRRAVELAGKCGYQALFTTKRGSNVSGNDLLAAKRIDAGGHRARWFRKTFFVYSRPWLANVYEKVRRRS